MATPPTRVYVVGNGTRTNFEFPFEYLKNEFVVVLVDSVVQPYTFLNEQTVTISPAPAIGTYAPPRPCCSTRVSVSAKR